MQLVISMRCDAHLQQVFQMELTCAAFTIQGLFAKPVFQQPFLKS